MFVLSVFPVMVNSSCRRRIVTAGGDKAQHDQCRAQDQAAQLHYVPLAAPRDDQCLWSEYRAIGHSPGVVLCGMGDGSVRAVSETVTQQTWSDAINPGDGNPLGGDL